MISFWTNQTIEAWNEALEKGYLIGKPKYIWEELKEPYHWMMKQMETRLPYYNGEYPIWVWTEKPDLRRSGHFEKGTHAVCLELKILSERVLLSDFDAWHCVLNNGFLALDENEWDAFYRGELKMTKEESWERIFNFESLKNEPWWNDTKLHLQGVTGKIDISQVRKVRRFVARGITR